jgi:thioredoxin 1
MVEKMDERRLQQILQKKDLVIVDFSSQFCGPCRRQVEELNKIENKFGNKIKIVSIETNQNPHLAVKYNIHATPTLMFFKDGKRVRFKSRSQGRVDRLVGLRNAHELTGAINYLLKMN